MTTPSLDIDGKLDYLKYIDDLSALVYSAGERYFDTLFGSPTEALAQLRSWCARPTSEYFCGRAEIILDQERCAAVLVHLGGHLVPQCKRADILALMIYRRYHKQLLPVSDAPNGPASVPADSQYLRALGVRRECRGRGYAYRLLEMCETTARANSAKQMILDVRTDNVIAQTIYERFGFKRVATWHSCAQEPMLTMAKPLLGR